MGNTVFSWSKKLTEIWYLLITEKFLFKPFWKWEIWSFLEPKSWRKYDIYWLLESSCFELFSHEKYGLFLSQEVDGRTIFSGYREVLVFNFSMMGNTVFFQSKKWWKDDIYMVFLTFLWYSRTWKIWFFAQCISFIKSYQFLFIFHQFNIFSLSKLPKFTAKLTISLEKKYFSPATTTKQCKYML